MKVGDYVRTDRGYITKIIDFKEHYTKGKRLGLKEEVVENFLLLDDKQCEIIENIDYSIPPCYPSDEELEKIKSHIIKSSPNIIDLIEVGDLVYVDISPDDCGGIIVPRITETENELNSLKLLIENKDYILKSIITHEQIESMKYKVKEQE